MRMTNAMRDAIIARAVEATVGEERKRVDAMEIALANAIYDDFFGKYEAIAKTLPETWYVVDNDVRISAPGFGSSRRRMSDDELDHDLSLGRGRPCACHRYGETMTAELKPGLRGGLYERAQEYRAARLAVRKHEEELRRALRTLCYSYNDTKRLRAAWPEGDRFIPAEASPEGSYSLMDPSVLVKVKLLMTGVEA